MYNLCTKNNAMRNEWLKGIMTFIRKKHAVGNLDNYRPITLIIIIYKIWAFIMAKRLNPVLNLLTPENQYAYKNKKSTVDILSMVNNQIKNDGTAQLILFDFSKAFGNIERDILWAKLYEDGLSIKFIKMAKMGHEGNKLLPKCDGYIGQLEKK